MAMFPCSVGNHRYQGPQQSAYLGASSGSRNERLKRRLCPMHIEELVEWANDRFVEIDVNAPPQPGADDGQHVCFRCSAAVTDWMLYVNVYPNKSEPRVWFGNACAYDVNEFFKKMDLVP